MAGLLWERQFEKNPFAARLGEGFQLGMVIRTPSNWLERNKTLIQCGRFG